MSAKEKIKHKTTRLEAHCKHFQSPSICPMCSKYFEWVCSGKPWGWYLYDSCFNLLQLRHRGEYLAQSLQGCKREQGCRKGKAWIRQLRKATWHAQGMECLNLVGAWHLKVSWKYRVGEPVHSWKPRLVCPSSFSLYTHPGRFPEKKRKYLFFKVGVGG